MFNLEQLSQAASEVFQSHGEQISLKQDEIYGKSMWAFHTKSRCLATDPDKATCIKKALHQSGYLQEVAAKLQESRHA